MPNHDPHLAALLDVVAFLPVTASIGWHSIPIPSLGLVLLADSREESTLPIMEAMAGRIGAVVATGSKPGTDWAGCLIKPTSGDVESQAAKLRGIYAIGTTDAAADDDEGPF